jgi:hypothetical protein
MSGLRCLRLFQTGADGKHTQPAALRLGLPYCPMLERRSRVANTMDEPRSTMTETIDRKIPCGSRWIASPRIGFAIGLLGLVAACFYYKSLLACCGTSFFEPVPHGLTFNSMLQHLLRGTFDVDPQTIGDEGSLRNGLVYTYFGVLPALLRLPFLRSADFAATDFTRLSCLAAVTLMAGFKVASAFTVWRANGETKRVSLLVLFVVAVLLSGPQIQFLRGLIYQEVILWAGALAAGFVFFVLRGYHGPQGFSTPILMTLALAAGLCLLTRVSTALGLYLAFGFLWLQLAWSRLAASAGSRSRLAAVAPLFVPMLVTLAFAAVTGFINFERWGNPLLFTDPHAYLWPVLHNAPERFAVLEQYGEFNFVRLGYGLIYYFFPVWVLRGADGGLWWSAFQQRTIDSVELPPSSFLASDPLIFGLAVYAIVQLIRHKDAIKREVAVPVLAGLFVTIILILILADMAFRYRMEFYPFFELLAFLGFGELLRRPTRPQIVPLAMATATGVIASHILWVIYVLTPFGTASAVMGDMGAAQFYLRWFQ